MCVPEKYSSVQDSETCVVCFQFTATEDKECIRHCLVANEIWSLFFGIGKTRKFTYIIVELELELDVTAFHLYS